MSKKKNRKNPTPKNTKTAHRKSAHTPQTLHKPPPPKVKNTPQRHEKKTAPIIPYDASSRILLVGEGDFSFSVSLLTHHLAPKSANGDNDDDDGINIEVDKDGAYSGKGSPRSGNEKGGANLVATSYDAEVALLEKYPQAVDNVKLLKERGVTVLHGVDVARFDKLPKMLRRRKDGFDCVGFMFPHVGGLSTDMGRQIKSNQGEWLFLRPRFSYEKRLNLEESKSTL